MENSYFKQTANNLKKEILVVVVISGEIKAIVFDVGNTLLGTDKKYVDYYREVLEAEKITFEEEKLEIGSKKAWKYAGGFCNHLPYGIGSFYSLRKSKRNALYIRQAEIVLKEIAYEGDIRKQAKRIVRKYDPKLDFYLFEDTKEMLPKLSEKYVLGLCSNWDLKQNIVDIMEKAGYLKYLDFIIQSNKVRVGKPHPIMYELVIRNTGVNAKEILFIGDREEEDYRGPMRMGMKALVIDRNDDLVKEDIRKIKTLREITHYLKEEYVW